MSDGTVGLFVVVIVICTLLGYGWAGIAGAAAGYVVGAILAGVTVYSWRSRQWPR